LHNQAHGKYIAITNYLPFQKVQKMKQQSQEQEVLAWLQSGASINPLSALRELGIFRLAACILRLRKQGHNITTNRITQQGRFRKVNFAEYQLKINND